MSARSSFSLLIIFKWWPSSLLVDWANEARAGCGHTQVARLSATLPVDHRALPLHSCCALGKEDTHCLLYLMVAPTFISWPNLSPGTWVGRIWGLCALDPDRETYLPIFLGCKIKSINVGKSGMFIIFLGKQSCHTSVMKVTDLPFSACHTELTAL